MAVLANADAAQAEAAVRAVDRWIARRPGEARSCPATAAASPPRSGTYAVDLPAGAPSEVLIGVPLPPADEKARATAVWLAAALDGADGLLAHALAADSAAATVGTQSTALARAWSAAVLGAPQTASLVVRVVGPDAGIDPAVAQLRALLDRLRQGALREEDRARAAGAIARARLAAALDPRARVIDLWRGDPAPLAPSLDDLRAFAAGALRDEAFVIVSARPPRPPPDKTSPR
jgi:hypothetical protein